MYSQETLDRFRLEGDALADAVVKSYFPTQKTELQSILDTLLTNASELPSTISPEFRLLYKSVFKSFSDSEAIKMTEGQKFFAKNASDIMLLLGFLSLPYCYAAAKGAEVLGRSNRIITEPAKRLLETAEFVFEITEPNAFSPEGRGFVSILKVRLIHAVIRWYINQSGNWDQEFFGVLSSASGAGMSSMEVGGGRGGRLGVRGGWGGGALFPVAVGGEGLRAVTASYILLLFCTNCQKYHDTKSNYNESPKFSKQNVRIFEYFKKCSAKMMDSHGERKERWASFSFLLCHPASFTQRMLFSTLNRCPINTSTRAAIWGEANR